MRNIALKNITLWGLFLVLLSGCQVSPTKVYTANDRSTHPLEKGLAAPLIIDKETIVIDVRNPFAYAISHFPSSIQLDWRDFSDPTSKSMGSLSKDLFKVARRLARRGISPKSKVIVIGEEQSPFQGRVAWALYYMGVENIQFANIQYFDGPFINTQAKPYPSVSIWKPKYTESLQADLEEIKNTVLGRATIKTHIIDVRNQKDYFAKKGIGLGYKHPDLRAIHIPWKEFFTRKGRPSEAMKKRLLAIGLRLEDRLIVISKDGVRSSGVTMALLSLGFKNTGSFSSGFDDIFGR